MKISRGRVYKINMGHYESVDFSVGISDYEVPDDEEDLEAVRLDIDSILDDLLLDDLRMADYYTDENKSFVRAILAKKKGSI
jgi:hypothetical protein